MDHASPPATGSQVPAHATGTPRSPQRLSRRQFLRWSATATLGAAVSACGLPQLISTPRRTRDHVELVYQDWREDWFPPLAQEMLAKFNETHPEIRVYYTPEPEGPQQVQEKMLANMAAGTAPDVFQGCCAWFPIWAQKGYTLDLQPFVQTDLDQATLDDWDPAQYRYFFLRDGRQYGLPKYHGALGLYYNRDLFDEYGVPYPTADWDHDDYQAAMLRLTQDRDGDGATDLWGSMMDVSWDRIQMHVNGWGGHLVDPADPARCLMAEPPALAAMEWLRARLWDDQSMASLIHVGKVWPREAFIAGKLAMVEEGSWALRFILNGARFRLGIAPFPAGPARRVTLATTDGFGIYKGTRHPEAAWELLRFLTGKEFGRAMARISFLQPARASLVDEWIGFVRAEFPEETRDLDIAAFAEGHRKGYSVTAEVAADMAEATRIAYAAWDDIFTLGRAPVERMAEVCREIEQAGAEAKRQGLACCS